MTRALPRPDSIRTRPIRLETKTAALADAPAAAATAGAVLAHTGTRTGWQSKSPEFDLTGDPDGTVWAIVAVTGVQDEVNDIIVPGAFRRTLRERAMRGVKGHDWNRPVARQVKAVELLPGDPRLPDTLADGRTPWPRAAGALLVKGRYILGTSDGRDAWEEAKAFDADQAYSIGYKVTPTGAKIRAGVRHIHDLDVYEFSPVLHGAHRLATQMAVKAGRPGGLQGKAASPGARMARSAALPTMGRCMLCNGPAPGSLGQAPDTGLVCAACVADLEALADSGAPEELPLFGDLDDDDRRGLAEPVTCGVCGQVAGGTVGPQVADRALICADCVAAVDGIGERRTALVDTGPTSREEYAEALRAERPMTMLSDGTVVYDRAAEGHGWTPGAGGRARP